MVLCDTISGRGIATIEATEAPALALLWVCPNNIHYVTKKAVLYA